MRNFSDISPGRRFLDLTIEHGCRRARRDDGAELRFTRNETALLAALIARPAVIQSRESLLTAMAGPQADAADRVVDFTVNRLRRKLEDPARDPRFIRAVYGEGYCWIAPEGPAEPADFVRLFPSSPHAAASRTALALDALADALGGRLPRDRPVRHCRSARDAAARRDAAFSVEASFHETGGALHAALVLREGHAGRVLAAQRQVFGAGPPDEAAGIAAEALLAAIWRQLTLGRGEVAVPSSAPLELRAHSAAELLMRAQGGAADDLDFLERAFGGGGATDTLIRAIRMHSRLLHRLAEGHYDPALLTGHFEALEALVLDALPEVQDDPLLTLAAAKLLVDADRRHGELAESLAHRAFERTTAFAAAFGTLGQIRAARGAFDEAIGLFRKGLALSRGRGDFEVYLLVWTCYAAIGAGDRDAFLAARAELFALKPAVRAHIGLVLFGMDAECEDPGIGARIAAADPARLRGQIEITYAMMLRRMGEPDRVRNGLRRAVLSAMASHGAAAVPAHVAAAMA